MSAIEKFGPEMIEDFLDSMGLKYLRDDDGDYAVQFSRDEASECQLTIWLVSAGPNKNIYCITIRSDKVFARQQWEECISLCNEWNRCKRWPKAYLNAEEKSSQETAEILLEMQIDLENGIHREFFSDHTMNAIACGNAFWTWMYQIKHMC